MDDGITRGVSINELLFYMFKHIRGMIILALTIAVLSGVILILRNYVNDSQDVTAQSSKLEIDDARKNILDKQAELYLDFWENGYKDDSISTADRIIAGYQSELIRKSLADDEKIYFNKQVGLNESDSEKDTVADATEKRRPLSSIIILALGLGIVTTVVVYTIKCIISPELPSGSFFRDRYGLSFIPWGCGEANSGSRSSEEISDLLKAEIEGRDLNEVFVTGTIFDDNDKNLISMIENVMKDMGVKTTAIEMDVLNAEVIRSVKRAGMVILIEHLYVSSIREIDDEIKMIKDNAGDITTKAILKNSTGRIK